MLINLRRSVVLALLAIVLALAYELVGTGLAQVAFRHQADGSITPNGSSLIGQHWTSRAWFHGRPDDSGPYAADPKARVSGGDNPLVANGVPGESGGTSLGPRSKVLLDDTKALVAYWRSMGVEDPTPDLVTTSASGDDPDIAPADALVQVPMVARATGITPSALRRLVAEQTHGEQLGFLGSSYLDVLQLNEALAALRARAGRS